MAAVWDLPIGSVSHVGDDDECNSILRHPNAVLSKNVGAKRCTVVPQAISLFDFSNYISERIYASTSLGI